MTVYKIDTQKIFWRTVEGRTFLCVTETGATFELEGAAHYIWGKMVEGAAHEDIIDQLTEVYEVDQQTARDDLSSLLVSLRNAGLIS